MTEMPSLGRVSAVTTARSQDDPTQNGGPRSKQTNGYNKTIFGSNFQCLGLRESGGGTRKRMMKGSACAPMVSPAP